MTDTETVARQAETEQAEQILQAGAEVLFVLPEDLKIDPKLNMRPYTGASEAEEEAVAKLAGQIARDGQINAGVVMRLNPKDPEVLTLLAGGRRRKAILLLNEQNPGQPKMRMRVTVQEGGDPRQIAFSDNYDRKNPSHMDNALLVKQLRGEFGEGMAGAGKIARYLGMDKATVLQYEKLLGAGSTKALQAAVHDGTLSMQSALEMLGAEVPESKQPEVIQEAKRIQEKTDAERIEKNKRVKPEQKEQKKQEAKAKKRVEAPAVRKAIKQVQPEAALKPKLTDVREWLEGMQGPAYGYPDGAVQTWVVAALGWLKGAVTEGKMQKAFDRMVEKADQGTKASLPKPERKGAGVANVAGAGKVAAGKVAKQAKAGKPKSANPRAAAKKKK